MEKYVEQMTQHLEGNMDYLSDPNTVQTDEQYDRCLDEIKDMDEIVRANKELDNKHDEEVRKIRSEMVTGIVGHIGGVLKFAGAAGLACLALFKDEDSVFSKQLSNLGNALSKLL
jgi:hypothetical protein